MPKLQVIELPDGTFEVIPISDSRSYYTDSEKKKEKQATGYKKYIYPARYRIRNWWDQYFSDQGARFPFYAFLLARDDDKEILKCVKEYSKILDRETGENCLLIIAIIKKPNIDKVNENFHADENDVLKWQKAFESYVEEDIPAKLGWLFGVETTDFPCLLLFEDLEQWQGVKVHLGEMNAEQVIKRITEVMSAARGNREYPYQGVLSLLDKEKRAEDISDVKNSASDAMVFIGPALSFIQLLLGGK